MKPNYFKHVTANAVALKPFPFPSELGMEAYLEENATILRCRPNDEIEIIGHEVRITRLVAGLIWLPGSRTRTRLPSLN